MRIGNEKLILVTPDAGVKIKELIQREEKGDYLRIKITGGGCNGLSYKMKFVDQGPPQWEYLPVGHVVCVFQIFCDVL